MDSISSIKQRLLNIAKSEGVNHQDLLTRLASERFLARLCTSKYADQYIFKGGRLLFYLIDTPRKTKDLDFSVSQDSDLASIKSSLMEIFSINLNDYFFFENISFDDLDQPHMQQPGLRSTANYKFDNIKGKIQVDVGVGDQPMTQETLIPVLAYKDGKRDANLLITHIFL